jgi:hypothetical protein
MTFEFYLKVLWKNLNGLCKVCGLQEWENAADTSTTANLERLSHILQWLNFTSAMMVLGRQALCMHRLG